MKTRRKPLTAIPPDLDLEGAHPVKQERSRQLRDKALAFGRQLVEQGRFASTSMADISSAVGCSVGALYFRFRDKEALFASVVEVAMARELEQLAVQVAAGRYHGRSLHDTVTLCVQDYVAFVQKNDSMIRALYQRATEEPGYWGIVREAAYRMTATWIDAVARAADRAGDRAFMRQAGIAFQFVSSALVYSVLIDRPVRPLSRQEMVFWLVEMVMHFIGLQVPEPLRATPVARPAKAPELRAGTTPTTTPTTRAGSAASRPRTHKVTAP